ncbi:MAG: hypothetical protein AB8G77_06775 [Rhodothermales bacterium]
MPQEIFVIIIVAIAAGTFSGVVSQIIGYMKSRTQDSPASDASMTTSELESMIQKWIGEATLPLTSRLDRIEEHLDPAKLNESLGRKSILDDMDGFEEEKELVSRSRTKAD